MGFYLRKSIKVGPFRFNLSKSGIGVSTGIPGFRIGTGPRGTYIHAGRGGLYFRQNLSGRSPGPASPSTPDAIYRYGVRETVAPLEDVESASVGRIADGTDFVAELIERRNRAARQPWVWVAGVLGAGAAYLLHGPLWLIPAIAGATILFAWYTSQRDQLRRTTVVMYELDAELDKAYDALHAAFADVQACARVWVIEAAGDVLDRKYHAGAQRIVRRTPIRPTVGEVPLLKTNVLVPLLPAGRQTLAFLPDRVLIFDRTGVGAVSYRDLHLTEVETHFAEHEAVPHDAAIEGETFRYVNKKGGPDRRFRDNPAQPIVRYGQLTIRSESGINEMFQCSQVTPLMAFVERLRAMATL